MKEITFQVKGRVHGKARPRFNTRTGRTYTPAATQVYERKIRQEYVDAGGEMLSGPIELRFEIVYGIQKTASKKERESRLRGGELNMSKPDVDNVEKIILDSLTGCAYRDDSCVVRVRSIKGRYEDEPRLIVGVREIEPEDIDLIHGFVWPHEFV